MTVYMWEDLLSDMVQFVVKLHLFSPLYFQEENKKKQLKVKIQMAKFLQDTVEEMAVTAKQKKTQEVVSEFANFFEKVRQQLKWFILDFLQVIPFVCWNQVVEIDWLTNLHATLYNIFCFINYTVYPNVIYNYSNNQLPCVNVTNCNKLLFYNVHA